MAVDAGSFDSENFDTERSCEQHRDAAIALLAFAERNPVLSAEEAFRSAQVHALLAIEGRLGQLAQRAGGDDVRSEARTTPVP